MKEFHFLKSTKNKRLYTEVTIFKQRLVTKKRRKEFKTIEHKNKGK